ncbi:MAG TPA: hypothetical protein VGW78_02895 [Candidatus Babeliales bacterium]|jgi:hypothetical protein|nr:hypothetical protein [Candidatus Babeliales bacterium]
MKRIFIKKIILSTLLLITFGIICFYTYRYYREIVKKRDVATIFNYYATEALKNVLSKKQNSTDQKISYYLEEQLRTIEIVNLIAGRNVEGIKKIDTATLNKRLRIVVPGNQFKNTLGGRLVREELHAENAIPLVLYHSALDKTSQDREKTINMLQVLFDKKLNPNIYVGLVSWIKDSPNDNRSLDYITQLPLLKFAKIYSFTEARKLLEKYMQNFTKEQ